MYLPNEIWDIIIGFSFSSCLFLRCVDKKMKSKIDELLKRITKTSFQSNRYFPFLCPTPIYDISISVPHRKKIHLYTAITQIGNIISTTSYKKITNIQISQIYNDIYQMGMSHDFQEKIYERLSDLFDYTFTRCFCDGLFSMKYVENYRKVFYCIFSGMRYYTTYYKKQNIKTLFEERLQFFEMKRRRNQKIDFL